MAKMRRYDIAGANFSIIPHAQGDYIKVSELSELLERDKTKFLTTGTDFGGVIAYIDTLLAAIDTEGK